MLACRFGSVRALSAVLSAALLASACEKVPLVAPTGSTITLNAASTVLSANGTTTITATVLESAGTPPHSGTRVTFTTTLGTIVPANPETDSGGVATAVFTAGGANGMATVSATSGAASTGTAGALRIAMGSAAAGKLVLNANPSTVASTGGSTSITAIVLDVNGNPLVATPVTFSTTAGTLSSALVTTDTGGNAITVLTTSQAATITATVGAQGSSGTGGTGGTGTTTPAPTSIQTATIQIAISAAPTISITSPTSSPSKGLPAIFTFVITPAAQNGNAVKSVTVNWGDGQTSNLGSVSGSQQATHVFSNTGTFQVSATVIDVAGGTNTASSSIVVIPVARPTILINSSPIPAKVNTQTTIIIQITVPVGIGITETVVSFGDGTSANLGGAASASPSHVYTSQGTFTVSVGVTDTSGQVTTGNTSISVGP